MPAYVSFVLINIKRLLSFSTAIFIADLFVYTFLLSIVKHYMISFTFNVTPISTTRQNVAVRLCLVLVIFPVFIHFLRIDYFPIAHNTLCLPPKFCITYCLKMLLGKCNTPRSI